VAWLPLGECALGLCKEVRIARVSLVDAKAHSPLRFNYKQRKWIPGVPISFSFFAGGMSWFERNTLK